MDSELEGSAQGIRAVKISLLALAVTASLQMLIAMASGSVALLADTVYNAAERPDRFPAVVRVRGPKDPSQAWRRGKTH